MTLIRVMGERRVCKAGEVVASSVSGCWPVDDYLCDGLSGLLGLSPLSGTQKESG